MKLPEHERQAHREAFAAMSLGQKIEYILAYYKLPIVLAVVALVFVGSVAHRALTEKRAVLYVAYANVAVNEGLDEALTTGYLRDRGISSRTSEVYRYRDLYLAKEANTADHQYAYASKLKAMAATDAEELDVVLMNCEAYDVLSASGYLLDLDAGLDALGQSLPAGLAPLVVSNDVVIEDNQLEIDLGEADTYEAVTEEHPNAIEAKLPAIEAAQLTDTVYLGIIANTPRLETSLDYLAYLLESA